MENGVVWYRRGGRVKGGMYVRISRDSMMFGEEVRNVVGGRVDVGWSEGKRSIVLRASKEKGGLKVSQVGEGVWRVRTAGFFSSVSLFFESPADYPAEINGSYVFVKVCRANVGEKGGENYAVD